MFNTDKERGPRNITKIPKMTNLAKISNQASGKPF